MIETIQIDGKLINYTITKVNFIFLNNCLLERRKSIRNYLKAIRKHNQP